MSELNGKPRLDPDVLTPRDMQRAKAGPLQGRSAYELMSDPEELFPLIIWCLRSREDPSFTWEQALDAPFGEFDMSGEASPPPTPPPGPDGSSGGPPAKPSSTKKPAASASVPSSASPSG